MSNGNEKEHGLKWWIRFVIVPVFGSGGIIAIVVALLTNQTIPSTFATTPAMVFVTPDTPIVTTVPPITTLVLPTDSSTPEPFSTPTPTSPPSTLDPEYATVRQVSIDLGATNEEHGLTQVNRESESTEPVSIAGREALRSLSTGMPERYVYFSVDRKFLYAQETYLRVTVEYFDSGHFTFWIDYDSTDTSEPIAGAFKRSAIVRMTNSGEWKAVTFDLPDALFAKGQHGVADFRIATNDNDLYIDKVTATKPTPRFTGTWQGSDQDDASTVTLSLTQAESQLEGTFSDTFTKSLDGTIIQPGFSGPGSGKILSADAARMAFALSRSDGTNIQFEVRLKLSNQNNTLTLSDGIVDGNPATGPQIILQRQ